MKRRTKPTDRGHCNHAAHLACFQRARELAGERALDTRASSARHFTVHVYDVNGNRGVAAFRMDKGFRIVGPSFRKTIYRDLDRRLESYRRDLQEVQADSSPFNVPFDLRTVALLTAILHPDA